MKVLHVIPDLKPAGAEIFLQDLLPALKSLGIHSRVISLRGCEAIGGRLQAAGISVEALHASGYLSMTFLLPRLRTLVRQYQPDVIHGWLYHGNLAAYFARGAWPDARLVWGIRHSLVAPRHEKAATRLVIRWGARLSRRADKIIYNAQAAASQHAQAGYASTKAVAIANGVDTEKFRPRIEERLRRRMECGFGNDDLLVGIVGRYHSIKGQDIFVRAARIAAASDSHTRFVMVGRGLDNSNSELVRWWEASDLRERVVLLGERTDMPDIYNMFDILVSASWGEGFPNAVVEAMASGVPCVVTDVGASRELVGDTGRVVPPGSDQYMAAAILELAGHSREHRRQLGVDARQRVISRYSRDRTVSAYADLYRNLTTHHAWATAG